MGDASTTLAARGASERPPRGPCEAAKGGGRPATGGCGSRGGPPHRLRCSRLLRRGGAEASLSRGGPSTQGPISSSSATSRGAIVTPASRPPRHRCGGGGLGDHHLLPSYAVRRGPASPWRERQRAAARRPTALTGTLALRMAAAVGGRGRRAAHPRRRPALAAQRGATTARAALQSGSARSAQELALWASDGRACSHIVAKLPPSTNLAPAALRGELLRRALPAVLANLQARSRPR